MHDKLLLLLLFDFRKDLTLSSKTKGFLIIFQKYEAKGKGILIKLEDLLFWILFILLISFIIIIISSIISLIWLLFNKIHNENSKEVIHKWKVN